MHEGRVVGQRQRALFFQVGKHCVAPAGAIALQGRIAGMHRFHLHRHVVLELGAIGDVQVHIHQRVPLLHQLQHGLHFRRVRFDVIAVEIEVLRSGAPAHLFGAALIGAVPGTEALMSVDVEYRYEHPHQLVEHAVAGLAVEQLAQSKKARVLAIDLAGVDAALDQDHRQLALRGRLRVECATGGGDQGLHRPALGLSAELDATHGLRVALRKRIAQCNDFVVAAGLDKTAALCLSGQRRGSQRGGGGSQQQQAQGQASEAGHPAVQCSRKTFAM